MVKLKIARVASAAAASAGLIASFSGFSGVASAHGMNGYDQDGNSGYSRKSDHKRPNNTVVLTNTTTNETNNVSVSNTTDQNAYSGNATVNGGKSWDGDRDNHKSSSSTGGMAMSGDALNSNSFNATVSASNSTPSVSAPVIPSTSSKNKGGNNTFVATKTTTNETNNVSVSNTTDQNAYSGNATVNGGRGGSATSGDASNYNSASVTVNATN